MSEFTILKTRCHFVKVVHTHLKKIVKNNENLSRVFDETLKLLIENLTIEEHSIHRKTKLCEPKKTLQYDLPTLEY